MISGVKTAITCILMVLVTLSTGAGVRASTYTATPLWGPYLTGTTGTYTVINWKTGEPTWGIVQYATEQSYQLRQGYTDYVIDPVPSQLHHVELGNLEPGNTYRYRVWLLSSGVSLDSFSGDIDTELGQWLRDNGRPTGDFKFRTLDNEAFTFIVYGDTQEQYPWFIQMERHKLIADYIAMEEDATFVIHLGDFTYDADDIAGWDMFFEAGREMLANNTVYPVMGNHENNSPNYYEIFGMPQYYSFQCGDAQFIMLDTNSWTDFQEQTQWLVGEFTDSKWKFVSFHHPSYSSDVRNYGGWQQSRDYWEDILVEKGVSAVFSGHVHAYERYLVRDIQYLVLGTGGGALATLSPEIPPNCQNRLSKTLGYARVTVNRQEVTIDIIKVASISDDNREVIEIHPFNSIFETFQIRQNIVKSEPDLPEVDFQVSPASLKINVESNGSSRFNVRITSSHDAQITIDTELLPFKVKPEVVRVYASEKPQRVELEILGSREIPNGDYKGKLLFRCDTGDNVALGIKINTIVSQVDGKPSLIRDNIILITVALIVVATNIALYVTYRRYRARLLTARGVKEDETVL